VFPPEDIASKCFPPPVAGMEPVSIASCSPYRHMKVQPAEVTGGDSFSMLSAQNRQSLAFASRYAICFRGQVVRF